MDLVALQAGAIVLAGTALYALTKILYRRMTPVPVRPVRKGARDIR